MVRRIGALRFTLLVLAVVAVVAAVALPVLAASPTPSGPGASGEKPGKGPKASREPEVQVTLSGVIAAVTDADGATGYTITADGKTVRLEAGPAWFWGDKNPLKAFVGKTVTITGEGSGDGVDVQTVDGAAIREPGRPPWAGGWKVVGEKHPGWSGARADRFAAKAKARGVDCWPPGLCKEHGPAAGPEAEGGASPTP
jgi:hypothetical protein